MQTSIFGGNISSNDNECKPSGVIRKIYKEFTNVIKYFNGQLLERLPQEVKGDLIIWMPNITNEEPKHCPIKPTGAVLICSKVMREGYTRAVAISRIFKMHGNAVIEIYKETEGFRFCLVDALGNEWINTNDIHELCEVIKQFYNFTKSAKRIRTTVGNELDDKDIQSFLKISYVDLTGLIAINKMLQEHITTKCGERYFGNISTRCQKLFPTMRFSDKDMMYVSPRNSDKSALTVEDMVLYDMKNNEYYSNNKPSVDSPCQALIYQKFPNIHYMIHGHAVIDIPCALYTENYHLCGDVNEVEEITKIAATDGTKYIINLKNHGFLLMGNTLEDLLNIVSTIKNEAKISIK